MEMKRIIVFLVTAVIICVAFASCGEDDPYSNIGDMLEADHKKVELTVTVNAMEGELTSKYTLVNNGSNKKMTYTYEKLNTFDKVNGSYVIPESYKSTYSGSVTVAANGSTTVSMPDITSAYDQSRTYWLAGYADITTETVYNQVEENSPE